MNLSFYTPIAYDFKYAFATILSYYDIANEIILGIDNEFISWSNKKFEFNEKIFLDKIEEIDIHKKIKIIKNNFHSNKIPKVNDTQERNYISSFCKKENYILGIDSDEILLNPNEFKDWFQNFDISSDIECTFYNVYKMFKNELLFLKPIETTVLGTRFGNSYINFRHTSKKYKMSPLKILHFSWSRSEQELLQKLQNWGHSKDFNILKQLDIWRKINLENFKYEKLIHPLNIKNAWLELEQLNLESFNLKKEILNEIYKW